MLMNRPIPKLPVEWCVVGLCGWQAGDLTTAWRHSPFDALGWLALGIWLSPTLSSLFVSRAERPLAHWSSGLSWAGLLICLIGILTDMHFPEHCALALACAAVTPVGRGFALWLALSVAWMPALGWWLGGIPTPGIVLVRLGLAVAAALAGFAGVRRHNRKVPE